MLQSNLQKFYFNRITVWRKKLTADNSGGYTQSWIKRVWDVPCRISGYTSAVAYKISVEGIERTVTHIMLCDKNTEIQLGDKIVDGGYDEKYILVKIKRARATREIHHLKCYLALTEGEDME